MTGQAEKAARFLALHHGERPLLLPNPWDRGSTKLLASLRELREDGTYGFWDPARVGTQAAVEAFHPPDQP